MPFITSSKIAPSPERASQHHIRQRGERRHDGFFFELFSARAQKHPANALGTVSDLVE